MQGGIQTEVRAEVEADIEGLDGMGHDTDHDTGLEVLDLATDFEFGSRQLHARDVALQLEGMRRVARAFVEAPETILQELVRAAVELCGADSAGISVEREDGTESEHYEWLATAGVYSGFLGALLPKSPSACGICLERGAPQHFKVRPRFFELLGVEAPTVTDGILLPWQVDGTRGTILSWLTGGKRLSTHATWG